MLLLLFARLALALSAENVTAGVHLSLGKSYGSFVVTWQTALIPADAPVFLYYGLRPDALTVNVTASSSVLANNEAADGLAHVTSWRNTSIHKALIKGVEYGQTVFYQISHSEDDNKVFNFTNWIPTTGARLNRPFTFAVFGDLGVKDQDGANWTLHQLRLHHEQGDIQAVLHVGDIAYDLDEDAGRIGDEFLRDMQPVAAAVPYMVCPGNHERDCVSKDGTKDLEGLCDNPPYTNYRERFAMPTPTGKFSGHDATQSPAMDTQEPMFWSVDVGPVHVVALNTDVFLLGKNMAQSQFTALQRQLEWLEGDLANATSRRDELPWIIAIGHQMLYSTHDSGHQSQAQILRDGGATDWGEFKGLEKLFHDYGVDLYFAGHEHVYEHFARIYKGARCDAKTAGTQCGLPPRATGCPCTAHIVVGNAGNREFPYRTKNGTVMPFYAPQPPYEHFRSASPSGYGLLTVHNHSLMSFAQYNSRTGEVIFSHEYHR